MKERCVIYCGAIRKNGQAGKDGTNLLEALDVFLGRTKF